MEFGHKVAKELGSVIVRNFTVLSEKSRRELDIGFRRVHLGRVAEAEHAAKALLRHRRPDGARGCSDHRRRLSRERVGAVRPACPVDRILETAGDRAVIFRSDEEDRVRGLDRGLERPRDLRIILVIVVAVERQIA